MIEFAKITGNTAKPNLIEVRMREGECLYAAMVVMGNSVSIPSELWILQHKDEFLALVSFEHDVYKNPMVIGFYPVKGADSSSYNVSERLLNIVKTLITKLGSAKVLTQLGPQQFTADTLLELQEMSLEVNKIEQEINNFGQ